MRLKIAQRRNVAQQVRHVSEQHHRGCGRSYSVNNVLMPMSMTAQQVCESTVTAQCECSRHAAVLNKVRPGLIRSLCFAGYLPDLPACSSALLITNRFQSVAFNLRTLDAPERQETFSCRVTAHDHEECYKKKC